MKKIAGIFCFLVLLATHLSAQKLTASVSKTRLAVGETFQLTFSLNASGGNFTPPALNDFSVYSGPNQSSSMSFINGVMSQSISLSYILAPKKEGKLTIGAATVVVNGNTLQSNPIVLDVSKGAPGAGSQGGQQQSATPPSTENIADNLFLRSTVSKTKVYQGEQITIVHKLYSRYQIRGFQDVKFPDYTGFWAQDMPSGQQIQLSSENIDGVNYQVGEMRRTYLFPQHAGKIEIPAMMVEVAVRKPSNRRPRDIWEQMFGGGYEDAVYSVKSKPLSIDVQPLPENGKPADFTGAVGEFSFKAQLSKDHVKANEGINLTVTITGKGNIKLTDAMKIGFPDDFETYDPKITENISTTANGVSGSKTFDYLVIPRHEGDYKIDQLHFTYFDPDKNEYINLPSPEFNINVEKGEENSAAVVSSASKQDLKILGDDIKYIKTGKPAYRKKNEHFFGSVLFYSGLASPLVIFLMLLIVRRKHLENNRDAVAVRSRKATRMARKRLAVAEQYLNSGSKEQFYAEIFRALYGYVSDKFNIPAADLNQEFISRRLSEQGVSPATIGAFITMISNCEYARYAPNAVSGDLTAIYKNTVGLITSVENEIS